MRMIDADALEAFVKTVRQGLYLDKTLSDMPTRDSMLLNFQQYVHLQPTIDAVPVVRCKDCENLKLYPDGEGTHVGQCLRWMVGGIDDDEYCSFGAKMESEGST